MGGRADEQQSKVAEWFDEIRRRVVGSSRRAAQTGRRIVRRYGRRDMRFVSAESVRLLVDASEAYPEMLGAIDAAAEHVELETYILRDDATGRAFQQALIRAASRGVNVRLLYDWIGSIALPGPFVRELTDAGVAVSVYHPLVWRRPVWAINKRDHRKMLVVDNTVSFTGGLNIGDEYQGVSDGGQGWRDTHVRLDGPEVAAEMLALFGYAWRRATPYARTLTRSRRLKSKIRRRMEALSRRKGRPAARPHRAGGIPISIVGNEVLRYRRRIHRAYLRAICGAQRYVLIENAYFIPSRPVRRALVKAARRGVFVGIVVGERSDVPITAYAMRWLYDQLLAGGVRLFEWPVSVMHAKTAVIDDAWLIVGSYNFDHRSLLHNLECVAVVSDADVAVHLRDQTLADIARCREIVLATHRKRPWLSKAMQYVAYLLRHWL
ncbi:phospholipase D-like domain-containing protein [Anaerobaca lacustris]|uniref:Phosphatidylserine/phosphatidylglycerophosphate/ cardiolipin synthase family protein n=1 Tax=Anaerobaca lacustris TaxID=3044600 RepID=A0AAW6TQW6_9BACT|nr:phosphatidylserine/phosphatidylglycerophosphate/cardiolipin synthase family protein [Sedimentisphaerales bacterium M17dextr]